jgi:methylphosphotriester-DNA--protein-cysteine methyltransferase
MWHHSEISKQDLAAKIKQGEIRWGGNRVLKIFGRLDCKSGQRMKKVNRVFFLSEQEAREHGYRPCGHCMPEAYKNWKHGVV